MCVSAKSSKGPALPKGPAHKVKRQGTVTGLQLNPEAEDWRPGDNNSNVSRQSDTVISRTNVQDNSGMLHVMKDGQQKQQQLLDAIQLPHVELMKFDGDPMKYYMFIRSFENSVDKDTIDYNSRLTRLMQYCTGKARCTSECCCVMNPEQGYLRAKELLKERFGNFYTILDSWVAKITDRPVIRPNDATALQDYADELQSCIETLRAMGKLSELNNQRSLVTVVSKLPVYLQNRWRSQAVDIRRKEGKSPEIEHVAMFVMSAAEEANDPVYGKLTEASFPSTRNLKASTNSANRSTSLGKKSGSSSFIVQADQNTQTASGMNQTKCPSCGANHSLFGCDRFKKMTPEERLKMTRSKGLCDNCLIPGHVSYRCFKPAACTVEGCGRKHSKFLHTPRKQGEYSGVESVQREPRASNSNQQTASNGFVDTSCNVTGTRQEMLHYLFCQSR